MRRLLRNELGQDLIEYMLLAAFLSMVGLTGVEILGNAMKDTYVKQDKAVQELWETPPPIKEKK